MPTDGAATNVISITTPLRVSRRNPSSSTQQQGEQKKPAESLTSLVESLPEVEIIGIGSSSAVSSRLTQEELYPARRAFSPEHITALRLLKIAITRCERSLVALNGGDQIEADTEIQKIQVLLPELFCCRTLGDGFGTVVNGLMCAFESLEGALPSKGQIRTLNQVLRTLREKPFLRTEEADELIEMLQASELEPYPAELTEFLSSDESVR